jgi:hypothetical protein
VCTARNSEVAVVDCLDLADALELVVVQPGADLLVEIGEQLDQLRSEELSLITRRDIEQRLS